MYSSPNVDYQPYAGSPNYGMPAQDGMHKPYSANGNNYMQPPPVAPGNPNMSQPAYLNGNSHSATGYSTENENSVLSGEDIQVMNESANAVNSGSSVGGLMQPNPAQPQQNWNTQPYAPSSTSAYDNNPNRLAAQMGMLRMNDGQSVPNSPTWQPSPTAPSYGAQSQPQAQPGQPPYGYGSQPPTGYGSQPPTGYGSQPPTGYPPNNSGGGYYDQSGNQGGPNANRARRVDPESLPNLLQFLADDRNKHGGVYRTGRGQVPPLTGNDFYTHDCGVSAPRFVRSTMNTVPISSDMAKHVGLPFGLVITPFARVPKAEWPTDMPHIDGVPLADASSGAQGDGPVRCVRCKAYIGPLMQFIDGGRRFTCPFCSADSDIPERYFAHLDHTGKRIDTAVRPELRFGTYELPTTTDYCRNSKLPSPPALIFVLDASYQAIHTGMFQLVCNRLRNDVLLRLPCENGEPSRLRVGFLAYASALHFYTVDSVSGKPRSMIVSELDDVFVPSLGHLLVPVNAQTVPVIDALLRELPAQFSASQTSETMLGPAVQAGLAALQAAETCGRLIVMHTALPTADVPGKLSVRDARKAAGSDKERQLLAPATNFYTKLAEQCVGAGVGVDLFLFPNSYCDVATLAELPRITGGNLYRYPNFQAEVDGERLMNDLRMMLERPYGFDGVMRVRCSGGIRAVEFYGNFHMPNTNDMEFGVIDSEKSIAVDIRYDDKLVESEGCCLQAALLYTSVSGQRRLRIFNISLNVSSNLNEIYLGMDSDATLNLVAKAANNTLQSKSVKEVEQSLLNQCAHSLACYRKNCAQSTAAGQLILPEALKVYPQMLNGALKTGALRGCSEPTIDDRCEAIFHLSAMNIRRMIAYFYPRLIPLHVADTNDTEIPPFIRCSYEKLQENGAYLLENGSQMFLWVGASCPAEFLWNVFGVSQHGQLTESHVGCELPSLGNPLSARVRQIVTQVREQRDRHMKLFVVKQKGQFESWMLHFLAEDQCPDGAPAYSDYLLLLHKEIRSQLS